ncbi:histidine kinase [Rhizobium sp. TRM96647]|uniref:sensor histidine kinase n=1 Tax=unclassified Rhizobium TaxID=2613769 RepID=UPI0021E8D2B5|nr:MULTISPECIES: sensor histidine kinase [unclassified Rhizobium]MCV3739496.1 histidine kinase [Rhizobium sp. TRM96647]MCV3761179.1 histidine kinase [Rhizobium sp. TRM96650]
MLDKSFCVTTANNSFLKAFRVERDDVVGQSFFELGNNQWDIFELRHLLGLVVPKAAAVIGYEVTHNFPTIGRRTFLIDARRLVQTDDNSKSILVMFDDVTDRRRRDAEQDFILSEMRHRMKNLFAVVRAVAMQTKAENEAVTTYRDSLLGRLQVTLIAQELAASSDAIDFEELLSKTISEPFVGRLQCSGPPVQMSSSTVLTVSMIFHELCTNAIKYGAFSVPEGKVRVTWSIETDEEERKRLKCEWREEDGPAISTPERIGYGTELIQKMSAHLRGAVELNYPPSGFTARIEIPV